MIQSITAVEWLVDHLEELETTCVVIGGESSGAHLAAEALLHLRSVGKVDRVAGFYSMCGAFDLVGSPSLRSAKHDSLLIDGPSALNNLRRLTPSLPDRFARGPLHSDLGGLPPALFIAGALDPIVDDSIEMSEKWSRQSKPAVCVVVPEAPHGFNRFPTSLAKKANQYGRDWMKKIVASDQRPRQRRDD